MSDHVSGTDRIVDFLRQHMLAKFCVQWPQFARLIEQYGEQEILLTYAEKLAGRGYKAAQIKQAIDKMTQNDAYYPKPYTFANMVKSPNFNTPDIDNRKLTPQEQKNVARILKDVLRDKRAQELHNQLGTDFKNRPGDTKQQYRAQIEKVAEQLLGRPLTK